MGAEQGRRRGLLHLRPAAGAIHSAPDVSSTGHGQGGLMGARVLVIDDEPAIVRAVRTNLHRHGFDVDTAASGLEALKQYDQFHPDVVLLDLGLPDMAGFEIIRAFRDRASTPIIVLSVRGAER